MRIGFIGAGKAGFTLGKYLVLKLNDSRIAGTFSETITVSGYYSRNEESARKAAAFTNTRCYKNLNEIVCESDVLMLTVPDGTIEHIWNKIKTFDIKGKIICHCSGAMASNIFSGVTEAGAFGYSIHPMYAISSKTKSYQEMGTCCFTVEGDAEWRNRIRDFIALLGNECIILSKENKIKYHAASVFASNLVNGLYGTAVNLLEQCGFQKQQAENALAPLFIGNAFHIEQAGPMNGLTGPIERNDTETVKKHLAVLEGTEQEIYKSVSLAVVSLAKEKHPDRDYQLMENLLKGF